MRKTPSPEKQPASPRLAQLNALAEAIRRSLTRPGSVPPAEQHWLITAERRAEDACAKVLDHAPESRGDPQWVRYQTSAGSGCSGTSTAGEPSGHSERFPLLPGQRPVVDVAVGGGQLHAGPGDLHRVAVDRGLEVGLCALGGQVDAAVLTFTTPWSAMVYWFWWMNSPLSLIRTTHFSGTLLHPYAGLLIRVFSSLPITMWVPERVTRFGSPMSSPLP